MPKEIQYSEMTCKYVDASDILLPLGREGYGSVMTHLGETQEWCWGSNNRSLISKDDFIEALRSIDPDTDLRSDDDLPIKDNIGRSMDEALNDIAEKMETLSDMCYIDLEN